MFLDESGCNTDMTRRYPIFRDSGSSVFFCALFMLVCILSLKKQGMLQNAEISAKTAECILRGGNSE